MLGVFVNLHPSKLSRGSAVALLVAGALFMENLDGTVILTAMPHMARSFHVQPLDLNIGVSAYLLALAALIPASGWVADRFGIRSVFGTAIVIFTVASILCGFCQNLTLFTLARILQGVGGAMMVPVGRLAVLRTTEKHELISAIATITWPGLAAPLLGPPLGGFIATYASWHWIFFLNAPLGIVALVFAMRLLPVESEHASRPFDGLGFILTGAACFALIYGLESLNRSGTSRITVGATLVLTAVIWLVATFHAGRHPHPMLDLRALRIRSYAVTIWGGSFFRIAVSSIPFLLPLLFQVGFGMNAFKSGLLVLAVFAGNIVMKPMTTPILRRFPFRTTMVVTGSLNCIIIALCALLSPKTPVPVILALLFASGLTRSMQYTALNTLAFADVPDKLMTGANTLFNMTQQLSMAMGIAFGAVALRISGLFGPAEPAGTLSLAHFHTAFLIVGAIALVAVLDVLRLAPSSGDSVRQPKPIGQT